MDKRILTVLVAPMVVACSSTPSSSPNPAVNAQGQLAAQSAATAGSSSGGAGRLDAEMQSYLANYVRPDTVLHSFHANEGMWVDCVDINRQPSMLTPAMAGQPIAKPPAHRAVDPGADPSAPEPTLPPGVERAQQDVALHANELDELGNVRHCDPGTVPIRRTTAADLARYGTLREFFSKDGRGGGQIPSDAPPPNVSGYQYANETQFVTNWGMQLWLNIWDPNLGTTGIHSLSQMWVVNNTGGTTETAEAGVTVDQEQFNDTANHLFIYWTDDGYQNTGCYNLKCSGFVQTDNSVVLGGYYAPVSTSGGTQYDVELSWEKDGSTANWWLLYQGTTWVGYYPASLYSHGMQTQASFTQYGGEVDISSPNGTVVPQMGSGAFASAGATYAAYQAHLQYINLNYNTIDSTPSTSNTLAGCYTLTSGYQNGTGFYFGTQTVPEPGYFHYFGGPGCR